MISSKVLPKGVQINHEGPTNLVSTLAGAMQPVGKVQVQGLQLPEFDKGLVIDKHDFLIFNADCKYDMILSGDFLSAYGINLNHKKLEVEWFENTLPINTKSFTRSQQTVFLKSHLLEIENDEWYDEGNDGIESYISTPILDAKYERANIDSVIEETVCICHTIND